MDMNQKALEKFPLYVLFSREAPQNCALRVFDSEERRWKSSHAPFSREATQKLTLRALDSTAQRNCFWRRGGQAEVWPKRCANARPGSGPGLIARPKNGHGNVPRIWAGLVGFF